MYFSINVIMYGRRLGPHLKVKGSVYLFGLSEPAQWPSGGSWVRSPACSIPKTIKMGPISSLLAAPSGEESISGTSTLS